MINGAILFILTLMLVIPMTIMGTGSAIISFPMLIAVFFYFCLKYRPSVLSKKILISLLFYLGFVFFVALVPLIHSTNAFELLTFVFYGLFVFISSILLIVCYSCHYNNFQYVLLRNLYLIGSLNAIVSILVLVSTDFRDLIYSIIDTSSINMEHLALGFRSSGLFFFGGSVMSLFHCLIIYIGLIYVRYKQTCMKSKFVILDIILIASNVLAVFLSGRMGVLILIAGLCFILFTPSSFTRAYKSVVVKIITAVFSILACLITIYYDQFEMFIVWAFELFINILNNEEVTTASTEVLKSMYHFPSDMIFGEGLFSMIDLGIDSGYVLLTWYFGILAIIALLSLFFAHFLIAIKNNSNKDILAVYLFCLFLILIGNIKDTYLFGSNGLTQIYFISILLCLYGVRQTRHKPLIIDLEN